MLLENQKKAIFKEKQTSNASNEKIKYEIIEKLSIKKIRVWNAWKKHKGSSQAVKLKTKAHQKERKCRKASKICVCKKIISISLLECSQMKILKTLHIRTVMMKKQMI